MRHRHLRTDPHPGGPHGRRARPADRRRPGDHGAGRAGPADRPGRGRRRRRGPRASATPTASNPAIGRIAALDAGLGTGVPGLQIDRRCGSGLQAVLYAAGAGRHRGGPAGRRRRRRVDVERRALRARPAHRRQAGRRRADGPPRPRPRDRRRRRPPGARRHDRDGGEPPRARTASRARSRTSSRCGPTTARWPRTRRAGSPTSWCRSPSPASAASPTSSSTATSIPAPTPPLESLGALRPIRLKVDPNSTVTAGNACGQNDGAAMCVVTTRAEAERRGLTAAVRAAVVGGRRVAARR